MKLWFLASLFPILLAQTPAPLSLSVGLPDSQVYPQYWNHAGKLEGYLPALLRRFAAEAGIVLDLRFYPVRRYVSEFKEERLDFITPSNPLWSENSSKFKVQYSISFMQSRAGFIGLTSQLHPAHIKDVTTLAGYTVSFLSDKSTGFKDVKLNYVNSIDSAMMILIARRTDLVYLHFDAVQEWLRKQQRVKEPVHFHEKYSELWDYHLATIKHPGIIADFNRWLQKKPNAVDEAKALVKTLEAPIYPSTSPGHQTHAPERSPRDP
ncbi:MAG TPA: hypothetical protein VE954_11380 [Oligoflexus sp.]|uniref:hypothetical protein n=1 Tax=Oligoflexus sp. TaxID=1971216 RepID=UPI002D3AAA80|nr:hypothetical protein [Oligoflexus sp.]HYX33706.1 hypothetical protein [Oligoflexus sp.]